MSWLAVLCTVLFLTTTCWAEEEPNSSRWRRNEQRERGLKIYQGNNLAAVYESDFTVTNIFAGTEPVFDFFRPFWRATLTPRKELNYPVHIRLKYSLGKEDALAPPVKAMELLALLPTALKHPWVKQKLTFTPDSYLTLFINQDSSGRDRLGLGYHLHHLQLEGPEREDSAAWEMFSISTTSSENAFWLNLRTGTVVYYESSSFSQEETFHQVNATGVEEKKLTVLKKED